MASRRSNEKGNDKAIKRESLKHRSSSSIRKKYRVPPQTTNSDIGASYNPSSSSPEGNPLSSSKTTYTTTITPLKSTTTPTTSTTSNPTTTATTITKMAASKPRSRKSNVHPAFHSNLAYLSQSLRPFISVTTGQAHPSFPNTLLAYHLLTSAQLDALVAHYHQFLPPVYETNCYPVKIPSWVDRAGRPLLDVPTATKRMLFGRFIGLVSAENMLDEEQAMLLKMEKEWQEELAKAKRDDEDREILRKIGGQF